MSNAGVIGWSTVSTVSTAGQVFTGAVTVTAGGVQVTGNSSIAGTLTVTGGGSYSGALTIGGGVKAGGLQVFAQATDPGCATLADLGKLWFNNQTATTSYSACLATNGTPAWTQLNNLGYGAQTFSGAVTVTAGGIAVTGNSTITGNQCVRLDHRGRWALGVVSDRIERGGHLQFYRQLDQCFS